MASRSCAAVGSAERLAVTKFMLSLPVHDSSFLLLAFDVFPCKLKGQAAGIQAGQGDRISVSFLLTLRRAKYAASAPSQLRCASAITVTKGRMVLQHRDGGERGQGAKG